MGLALSSGSGARDLPVTTQCIQYSTVQYSSITSGDQQPAPGEWFQERHTHTAHQKRVAFFQLRFWVKLKGGELQYPKEA